MFAWTVHQKTPVRQLRHFQVFGFDALVCTRWHWFWSQIPLYPENPRWRVVGVFLPVFILPKSWFCSDWSTQSVSYKSALTHSSFFYFTSATDSSSGKNNQSPAVIHEDVASRATQWSVSRWRTLSYLTFCSPDQRTPPSHPVVFKVGEMWKVGESPWVATERH